MKLYYHKIIDASFIIILFNLNLSKYTLIYLIYILENSGSFYNIIPIFRNYDLLYYLYCWNSSIFFSICKASYVRKSN